MKRIALVVVLLGAGVAAVGCNKPSEDSCRKAILNIKHLHGTDNITSAGGDLEGEVRRCRGGSTREAVACADKATTLDELETCDFNKTALDPGDGGSAAGSGSASSGGSGSAK
nr:hypothetical protein [Kofleriaceae bacterium]